MLVIIHLSDLHITSKESIDESFIDAIYTAVKSEITPSDTICYICSGDISYSGKQEEYNEAENFFLDLLTRKYGHEPIIIFCPGNHDNNFDRDSSVRSAVIKQILSSQYGTEEQIKECLGIQNNYHNFTKKFLQKENYSYTRNLLNEKFSFECEGKLISITSINSAYCCEKDCSEGKIFIPQEYLIDDTLGSDYKIAVLHHTPNWFMSQKQLEIRSALNSYDLIFFGHEHRTSNYIVETEKSKKSNFIDGGIINFNNNESSFNLLKIDFTRDAIDIIEFKYDKYSSIYRSTKKNTWPIADTKIHTNYTKLIPGFVNFLDDAGANFIHPHKEIIKFSDIYIPPSLRSIQNTEEKLTIDKNATDLLIGDIGKILIYGDDKSGKTSLAKFLFSELISNGFMPVYIDAPEHPKSKILNIPMLVRECYKSQYQDFDLDIFKQTCDIKAVPIIDNFNLANINNYEKMEVLRKLITLYNNLVIIANDSFLIDELKRIEADKYSDLLIRDLSIFFIKSFGHKLRGKLVRKWLQITDEQMDYEESSLQQYDEYMNLLSRIVSQNFVPPFPIYFLTALSAVSTTSKTDISIGSYGHYYQALITLSLANKGVEHADLDMELNFLSELSYKMFKDNVSKINKSSFKDFINEYNTKFDTMLNESFITSLVGANIITHGNDSYRFKYKFMVYYFIAYYISKNLHEDKTVEQSIDRLISSLHLQSSTAILLILITFTKDTTILKKIYDYAKSLFPDSEVATISEDTEHFNLLVNQALNVIVSDACKPSDTRTKDEAWKDSVTTEDTTYLTNDDKIIENDDDIDNFTARLSATVRCTDIIGQILKSHYGSLLSDSKNKLFAEGIYLSLRTLGDFYSFMSKNSQMWLDDIEENIRKKGIRNDYNVIDSAKKTLLLLSSFISYCFISLPVNAFATNNLYKTHTNFFENLDENERSNAIDIIQFSLDLSINKKIPFDKLEKLIDKLSSNVMGYTVLQHIITNHLYLHYVNYADKAKISELMKISIRKQRAIDAITRDK